MTMCIFGFCSCDACGCDMPGVSFAGIPSGPDTVDILFDTDSVTGAFQLMRAAN
jgi:hypothetical protein